MEMKNHSEYFDIEEADTIEEFGNEGCPQYDEESETETEYDDEELLTDLESDDSTNKFEVFYWCMIAIGLIIGLSVLLFAFLINIR